MAIGDMQLTRWEFEHEMTWGEFICRYMGWAREECRGWDRARHIIWSSVAPHSKRRLRPKDLMRLPTDPKPEIIDKELYERLKCQSAQ